MSVFFADKSKQPGPVRVDRRTDGLRPLFVLKESWKDVAGFRSSSSISIGRKQIY